MSRDPQTRFLFENKLRVGECACGTDDVRYVLWGAHQRPGIDVPVTAAAHRRLQFIVRDCWFSSCHYFCFCWCLRVAIGVGVGWCFVLRVVVDVDDIGADSTRRENSSVQQQWWSPTSSSLPPLCLSEDLKPASIVHIMSYCIVWNDVLHQHQHQHLHGTGRDGTGRV